MTQGSGQAKVRVVMTIGRLNIGGAERRLLQLMQHLKRVSAPVAITFFVVSGNKGRLDDAFRRAGATIVYGRPSVLGLFDFARLCRRLSAKVVHANSGSAGGFYCLAARLGGVQHSISHIRSCGPIRSSRLNRYGLFYEPFTSLVSKVVVGVSAATKAGRSFRNKNWMVIHNGIDPVELRAAQRSEPPNTYVGATLNFVILGRLDRLKNIPHAIRSFAGFVKKYGETGARLHVIGPEGDMRVVELEQIADEEGISDQIVIHGPTEEPMRYFQYADCAMLPSHYEGLPGGVLEALACGTPVVASDIGPAREIASLTSGLQVMPVELINGWSEALKTACSMDRKQISKDFWEASPFSLEQHADAMLALWLRQRGAGTKT